MASQEANPPKGSPRAVFGAMLRHFIACIRGDTPYAGATPEDAIESMRIAMRLVEDAKRQERSVAV